jgi:hypothetical protein
LDGGAWMASHVRQKNMLLSSLAPHDQHGELF